MILCETLGLKAKLPRMNAGAPTSRIFLARVPISCESDRPFLAFLPRKYQASRPLPGLKEQSGYRALLLAGLVEGSRR
jgi:hypothetical protein